ncbi:hypothetical protein FFLO_01363 [Filobasidium floriforme]|uniref:Uncharacterized protein n=1 Tax=Filobasidium floriforme TaxID=5210 RepID=A0A8K0NQ35_9TREE|nr:hypothetical protein FFLO_01363 [Filobasidium floriforme]
MNRVHSHHPFLDGEHHGSSRSLPPRREFSWAPVTRLLFRKQLRVICHARGSLFVCVIGGEVSHSTDMDLVHLLQFKYPPRLAHNQLSTTRVASTRLLPDMPDSSSESRPLISPSAQSQPRPLTTTTVDKRKQDKSVIKSSLDIVFSCKPHGHGSGYMIKRNIELTICRSFYHVGRFRLALPTALLRLASPLGPVFRRLVDRGRRHLSW